MNSLEAIAKRISEIHDEIEEQKSVREINLAHCHGSPDEDFEKWTRVEIENGNYDLVNCLMACYEAVKQDGDNESFTFEEAIQMYGCKNCKAAYKAKKEIGKLKQERGRLIGNITMIGRKL